MKKLLFLVLISPFLLTAQDSFLKGQIYADSISDYQVNVININQKIGSVSNPDGEYKIRAHVGDSILFTSLQHRTYTLKVEENNLQTSTSIFLELEVNELPEVTLNPYDLTGDLSKDMAQVKVDFVDQRQFGFGVPRQLDKVDREIYTANTSSGGIPLAPLINWISGETKMLKKRKENAIVQSNKNKVLRKVTSDLITKDLRIPKIYIEDFAYFCAEDQNTMSIVNQNDPLALIDELKLKAIAYLKLKAITE
ncbi:hypothetical protein G3567_02830 [Psychroflexus sp. YR1-1]|uniref:CarboxypepD_reg-like domain-containing protein n=1 Tax=Psychroflexus aurantiacus TaxID=2709310 RepID=A0A6B3QZ41_9FLAO|nr:hypothetical protein [Psychroflexus aurantiacus]NEV93082.1 hypothetical protein [Psychroflexus aurantiacus]